MTDSSYSVQHQAADGNGTPVRVQYGTRGINWEHHISDARLARAIRLVLGYFGDWAHPELAALALSDPDDAAVLQRASNIFPRHSRSQDAYMMARAAIEGTGQAPDDLRRACQ